MKDGKKKIKEKFFPVFFNSLEKNKETKKLLES
ncbi:MAG: hypothetical protein CM15mP58_22570 [Burkholderiaceae bacterium]|nr:MAG: hypothetical protein CM15mP58_22570 [Burkholderiaceae bacterium]